MAEAKNLGTDRNVWQFLADASPSRDGREYAVYFDGGGNPAHIEAYSRGGAKVAIEPGELIYAVDDWRFHSTKDSRIATTVYQIEAGADGRIESANVADVDYDITVRIENGEAEKIELRYAITADSKAEMEQAKFNRNFPTSFKADVTGKALPGSVSRDADGNIEKLLDNFIANMPFPPFHPTTTAALARAAVDEQRPPPGFSGRAAYAFNAAVRGEPENPQVPKEDFKQALADFCEDLTEKARKGGLPAIAARDKDIRDVMLTLTLSEDASVCLIGDAGVGKSAIKDGVAQAIADGDCPPALKGARVLQVNLGDTQASKMAMYRGNVEAQLKNLLIGNAERGGYLDGQKLIFVFDDLTEHLQPTGAVDKMKRMLGVPGVASIATTTVEQYDRYVKKVDMGLARRFKEKIVEPAPHEAVLVMMEAAWPRVRDHHGVRDMPKEELHDFVAFTDRVGSQLSQPQRARRALDLAAAHARDGGRHAVEQEDKIYALSEISGRPAESLMATDYQRIVNLDKALESNIIGQKGLKTIALRLAGARGGLVDPNKPLASFLFLGPTGVGKTETAKQIAKEYFGDENAFARIDMSQYKESHTVGRLIGAPAGYVGYTDGKAALYDPVRKRPGGLVLLLDEIEKGHQDAVDTLLGILDDGKALDNHERKVDFTNVVIIMTSNLGSSEAAHAQKKGRLGFGNDSEEARRKEAEKVIDAAPAQFFRNEFLGRMEEQGGVVRFDGLQRDHIAELARREIVKSTKRLAAPPNSLKDVKIELAPAAFDDLVTKGYDPVRNARPLKGAVNRGVNDPLGMWILNPENGSAVRAFAKENGGARLVIETLGPELSVRLEKPDIVKPVIVLNAAGAVASGVDETANDNAGRPEPVPPLPLKRDR